MALDVGNLQRFFGEMLQIHKKNIANFNSYFSAKTPVFVGPNAFFWFDYIDLQEKNRTPETAQFTEISVIPWGIGNLGKIFLSEI